jgi:hemolysin III
MTVRRIRSPASPDARPLLRGWIHAAAAPAALAAVVVLICRAPTVPALVSAVAFAVCAVTLFAVSALYHLGAWPPRVRAVLRSVDHADILFLIAGTYTPFAVLVLRGDARVAVLCVVWTAATLGAVFRVAWTGLPRWVYVALYLCLGWVAVPVLPQLLRGASSSALVLVVTGGVMYTLGGVVYGLKRPDPWPRVFGFHEIFHAFTVAAFTCQYVAVWLVIRAAGW